jgi:hypothetical protein
LRYVADQVFHGAISFAGGLEVEATKQRGRKYFEHFTDEYCIGIRSPSPND